MSAKPHISDDQIIAIIERMADGINLKESTELDGFSVGNIYRRINASPELSAMHARAREDYQRIRVDEMNYIAKTEVDVARARLRCDNIKWEAARVLPKVFGDAVNLKHSDPDGGPVQTVSEININLIRPKPHDGA